GNPSKATKVISNTDNYLLEKKQFVLSYNNTFGRSNWVSWHLSTEWIGNVNRQDDFRPDNDLPSAFYRPGTQAFSGTGFDRGHLCPSSDRDANIADNSATFVMSNIIAQAPDVNQQNWAKLETYCRKLVSQGNELYIMAGGFGEGGIGSSGSTLPTKVIDNGRIRVPAKCWKVIVILPSGTDDVNRISDQTRVIAVVIPNEQSAGFTNWGNFRVSVRDLEGLTSYDFLSKVPKSIQDIIEKKVDNGPTQ
ncbi:MAG: DNA/RNA non-specific endonuclease, partial [Saprospiraceae bacterium]